MTPFITILNDSVKRGIAKIIFKPHAPWDLEITNANVPAQSPIGSFDDSTYCYKQQKILENHASMDIGSEQW